MRNKTLLLNNFHDTNIYVYCRLSMISFNTALMNRFHMQSISLNNRRFISSVDIRKAEEDGTGFLRSYFFLSLSLNITCFSLPTLFFIRISTVDHVFFYILMIWSIITFCPACAVRPPWCRWQGCPRRWDMSGPPPSARLSSPSRPRRTRCSTQQTFSLWDRDC